MDDEEELTPDQKEWVRRASKLDAAWAEGQHRSLPPIRYMTIHEILLNSSVSRATIYRAMETGQLPYVQHGERGRRVEEADFILWMERGFPTS